MVRSVGFFGNDWSLASGEFVRAGEDQTVTPGQEGSTMSEQTVGRLLVVGLRGAVAGDPQLEQDLAACGEAGIGGVILFDVDVPTYRRLHASGLDEEAAALGAPRNIIDEDQLRDLVAHIRAGLGSDVWVSIDQEGGSVARLSARRGFDIDPSATAFTDLAPPARTAAARRQAERLAGLGFDLNFAPCVDLALNPANELIAGSERTYGDSAPAVIEAARTVIAEHRRAGVAACLKHFPGHGSSTGDTHHGAVDITATWQREPELAPYRALCDLPGVAVMVAHVRHRGLDAAWPASLSPVLIDGVLRGELGFAGVVVTDSIDMRAVADHHAAGDAAVAAVNAGADLVVDGFNLEQRDEHPAPALVGALDAALADGRIQGGRARIDASLRRLARLRAQIADSG